MLKKTKKIVALVLSVLTVFGCFSLAASAAETVYPTIYITGYGTPIYSDKMDYNSEPIYPTGVDVVETVKEALVPCLSELAMGAFSGDYDAYCDTLYNSIAPIYDKLRLSPDGTVKDNSGRQHKGLSATKYGYYYIYYDWRLSPIALGDELAGIVDEAIKKTGAKKVNIVGRCYGANILSSYLQNNENVASKINKAVFFIPSTEGIGLIGAIFSGKIDIQAENIDTFVSDMFNYVDVIDDTTVKDFISLMLTVFEQASLLDLGAEKLQELLDNIKDNLLPRLIRDTYGSFPSFWAMVPDEYFADAVKFVYNTDELKTEYAGTIKLITKYHDEVQANSRARILELKNDVDFYVISKYNLPTMPIFDCGNATSDAVAETYYTSFGATTAEYGKTLSADYIKAMAEEDKKYLSADEKIDASTCLLPETTWFIKNSYHDHFTDSQNEFIDKMLTTTDMTVETFEEYPQYVAAGAEGEGLSPVVGKDKDTNKPVTEDEQRISLLFRFINFIVDLIIKWINKK